MSDLLAARSQMAMSLAFHIIFAVVGIAMPLMMVMAEWKWLRTRDDVYLTLAKQWAKGTAILFAVGAVSGTVLSFELGLLWPEFMRYAGPIIGMPFSLEGFAFFLEAIFLGIYLYGWKRVSPWAHWFSGVMVAFSGMMSGVFVVTANAWMNTPAGFELVNGKPVNIDPIAAMLNPAAVQQVVHMTLAAYAAVGFAVAAIHAFMLRRDRENLFHRRAFVIAFIVGAVTSVLQPLSGDFLARQVFRYQPIKLAAMEGQFETERRAPLRIGGWPDEKTGTTRYAIDIPAGLSLLVHHDPDGEIKGLNEFPRDEWPPVAIVHVAFQIMVGCGMTLLAASLAGAWLAWRKKKLCDQRWFLTFVMLCGPLGFIAIEAGWTVTEVGRQPWIIYNYMRTADAVTPMPGLIVPFISFTILYIFLAFVVVFLLKRQVFESPRIFRPPERTKP
ncbi:MAG TPA: cytochrome ubiquinol oxidase subunit I [Verrucomicrobiae bacterium]|nr:cytochrome ubiquinol oxidase subunit I [Verrucomicrobiae bacterium]